MNHDSLQVRINAENAVNKAVLEYAPALFDATKDFVGKPVFKADGSLRKDFKSHIDRLCTLPNRHDMTVYPSSSSFHVSFTFKACEHTLNVKDARHGHVSYSEKTVYLATVENGTITEMREFDDCIRTDHTLEEVLEKRAKCDVALDAYNKARAECYPFD